MKEGKPEGGKPDTRTLLIILAVVGGLAFGCMSLMFAAVFLVPVFNRADSGPDRAAAAKQESAPVPRRPGWQAGQEIAAQPSAAENPFAGGSLNAPGEMTEQEAASQLPGSSFPGDPRAGFGPTRFGPSGFGPSAYPPGWMPPPGAMPPPGWIPPPGWTPTGMMPPGFGPPTIPQPPNRGQPPTASSSSRRTTTRSSSGPEGMSESQRRTIFKASQTSKDHDALCEKHRIKKSELEHIIAEGKQKEW